MLPYRLAVISASDAAGYRDFMKHLHDNVYGFVLRTELFGALMQGAESPSSIIGAMEAAAEWKPDAILILRGGGGRLDLSCYDDYALAAGIARCPIPVFTAIGHDQDYHVCDMVAYRSVKTPTALADEFLSYYMAEDERIISFSSRLRRGFDMRLNNEKFKVDNLRVFISNMMKTRIIAAEAKLDFLEMKIDSNDAGNILAKGYSIALDKEGVKINSVKGREKGDSVSLVFADGRLDCEVVEVKNEVIYGKG